MKDLELKIRKLARSSYWQNYYNSIKELGCLSLFENKTNLSGLQVLFLYWLRVYDMLYSELAQKEWKYLDENVINDDIRTDAFLYFRSKKREQEIEKYKHQKQLDNLKLKNKENATTFDVDFRRQS